ncbi:MAG: GDSL-type esterase/lipase family protein [Eubacteriales bacterium]|nr:GDSL-type esterase/lipase family protein [Eubacteriales bacterium]
MMTNRLNQIEVKHIGRTHFYQDVLWLILSGSGVEFSYTGKELALTICGREAALNAEVPENYPRVAVYVNDERVVDTLVDCEKKECVILHSTEEQTVDVKIIKLSECAMSMCGIRQITSDTSQFCAGKERAYRMEFIGDSITCGYGVDDEDCEHHFSTATEDVTKAFAYKTAMALDADYSMFSTSGHGIISGYTDDLDVKHTDQRIPDRYTTLGLCFDTFDGTLQTTDVAWDFERFQPDLIVINLGTNDDSYCQDMEERQMEYKDAYKQFLHLVRSRNAKAHIVCVLGLMGNRLYPFVCKACQEYAQETGDQRISTFELPEQDGNVGYVADYHPMECFHQKASDALVAYIKTLL